MDEIATNDDNADEPNTTDTGPSESTTRQRPGFPAFADLIAVDTDLQIYRRYDRLAARNLLYLQSELRSLEVALENLDERDAASGSGARHDWDAITGAMAEGEQERYAVVERLRLVMKEYQEALLRHSALLNLEAPPDRSRQALTYWFRRFKPLSGTSEDLFGPDADDDLVALRTPPDQDRLTTFLEKHLSKFIKTSPPRAAKPKSDARAGNEKGNASTTKVPENQSAAPMPIFAAYDPDEATNDADGSRGVDPAGGLPRPFASAYPSPADTPGIYYYRESTISQIVSVVSVLLAAILLVGAIVSLYYVRNNGAKLGMIAGYTLVFAASIGLLTNSRRGEVYATTAAYAAVLVVFVSGGFGG